MNLKPKDLYAGFRTAKVPPLWAWVLFFLPALDLYLFRVLVLKRPFGMTGLWGELLGSTALGWIIINIPGAVAFLRPRGTRGRRAVTPRRRVTSRRITCPEGDGWSRCRVGP